jgi:hypothetical protein
MSNALRDRWLPEVEAEFDALLHRSRSVCARVGNLFRAFEKVVSDGVDGLGQPLGRFGSADVYVMYAEPVLLCFAVSGREIAIVKWAEIGTEYKQQQDLEEAKRRAARLFP